MIKITYTYETWTEDDIDFGEPGDTGVISGSLAVTFSELVHELEKFPEAHCSFGIPCWASTPVEHDYRAGTYTRIHIHPGRDARSQRYWAKAWHHVYG